MINKPRRICRRRFRFGVRTLITVVVLICASAAILRERQIRELPIYGHVVIGGQYEIACPEAEFIRVTEKLLVREGYRPVAELPRHVSVAPWATARFYRSPDDKVIMAPLWKYGNGSIETFIFYDYNPLTHHTSPEWNEYYRVRDILAMELDQQFGSKPPAGSAE